jgi:hypothetical protein
MEPLCVTCRLGGLESRHPAGVVLKSVEAVVLRRRQVAGSAVEPARVPLVHPGRGGQRVATGGARSFGIASPAAVSSLGQAQQFCAVAVPAFLAARAARALASAWSRFSRTSELTGCRMRAVPDRLATPRARREALAARRERLGEPEARESARARWDLALNRGQAGGQSPPGSSARGQSSRGTVRGEL